MTDKPTRPASRAESRLYRRLMRLRYPIADDLRLAVVTRMRDTLRSPDSTAGEAAQAARTILEADRVSLEATRAALAVNEQVTLAREIEALRAAVEGRDDGPTE